MLRKKGIIGILVFVGIVIILSFIFTDSWLESTIKDIGASVAGAKVEIDGLDLSLMDVSFSWDRLQVADKSNTMKNLIETGVCKVDLEFWPLLSKKIIIEKIELTGIETSTDRETDGKIEGGGEEVLGKGDSR